MYIHFTYLWLQVKTEDVDILMVREINDDELINQV